MLDVEKLKLQALEIRKLTIMEETILISRPAYLVYIHNKSNIHL